MYGDKIVDNDCAGVRFVATDTFYDAVKWSDLQRNYLRDPAVGEVRHVVEQAVVRYRLDDRARLFFTGATDT